MDLRDAIRSHVLALPDLAKSRRYHRGYRGAFRVAGQRILDGTMLNAVLVVMLATSILGPVLTERFAPRILDDV